MTTPSRPKIVVGIDGSESSSAALAWAHSLAAEQSGTVSAVMAWNYPAALLVPVVGAPVLPADYMAESSRGKLSGVVAATTDTPESVEQWVVMGSPRTVLTEASEDHDLLVLGRTGAGRLKKLWLGSTSAYCVRHAECPVVVVRNATQPETQITVAVDGSAASIEALTWALSFGENHQVLAVYSHDEWELDDLPLDDKLRADLDAQADRILAEAVQAVIDRTGVDGSRINRQVRQGDPRTTIVDQAEADELLVLGAQGHSGLARWMLGSLADYAVNHAPGSVAVWR